MNNRECFVLYFIGEVFHLYFIFTTERMFIVFLLSQCILGSLISAKACFDMFPRGDVFITAGKQLQLNCSLKLLDDGIDCGNEYDAYNTSLLRILKGSQTFPPILLDYFEDQKTLMLTIQNVTFEDDGYYRCLYGNSFQSLKRVSVGVPPEAPANLSCISRNLNDLTCYFTLSKAKVNIPTSNIPQFRLNEQANWTNFPESNFGCSDTFTCSCWLDSRNEAPTSYTFMPTANYKIRVLVENKLGENATELVIGNTASIVKPDPVVVNYTTLSRRLRVAWSCPKELITVLGQMDYKINITSKWDSRIVMVENRTTNTVEQYIENLTPYTSYSVTVQAKPSAALLDIYWSDASRKIMFDAISTVSEYAVLTTSGSYMMLEPGRTVIYWKNPARRYWYGLITGYQIMLEKVVLSGNIVNNTDLEDARKHKMQRAGTECLSENITGITVTAVLKSKLLETDSYQVEIKLENSKGVSSNSSKLFVPNWKIGQALRPKWVSVETAVSSGYISWYMDQKYCAAVSSVTYYWCKVDIDRSFNNSYVPCKDQFDWINIKTSDGCGGPISYEIRDISNHQDVKYAVSVETAGQLSGGMMWENFRFRKFGVPETPLYAVSAERTNLKVEILYGDYYESEGGKPDSYSVEYTECFENDDCISAISNSTVRIFPAEFLNPEYIIGDLKSGTQYQVLVASVNSLGRSEYGKPFLITLNKDVETSVTWIAKTLGGIAGGVVCVLIVLLACLGKKRYNTFKKKAVAITIPGMDEINMFEEKDGSLTVLLHSSNCSRRL